MSNQMIDGVPRELLERICAVDNGGRTQVQHHYDLIDLRALLDAPTAKNWEYFYNAMESERDYWKSLAQKPATQPQGDPVAFKPLW